MARTRRPTKRCTAHGRRCYRHEQEAITALVALYDRVPEGNLAVYWCEQARAYHVTTRSFKAAMVRVAG